MRGMIPSWIPWPTFWIIATGIAEIGGALLLQFESLRPLAGKLLALLMVFIWPANIVAATKATGQGLAALLWIRCGLQVPLIWLHGAGIGSRSTWQEDVYTVRELGSGASRDCGELTLLKGT
mmetsp:Transcript_143731/g.250519  ORF Transcript_143731/g.250519 Transcript_143731/m.250519 type:complete len:122 (+) Transcript_143731:1-366(+)